MHRITAAGHEGLAEAQLDGVGLGRIDWCSGRYRDGCGSGVVYHDKVAAICRYRRYIYQLIEAHTELSKRPKLILIRRTAYPVSAIQLRRSRIEVLRRAVKSNAEPNVVIAPVVNHEKERLAGGHIEARHDGRPTGSIRKIPRLRVGVI